MSAAPMLREKLKTMLGSSTSVASVVGNRYFTMRAPQGTPQPYIVVWLPAHTRVSHLEAPTFLENVVVRFDLFGTNYMQLDALRDSIIGLMTSHPEFSAIYQVGAELYEDDTRLYHLVADFSVWNYRNQGG